MERFKSLSSFRKSIGDYAFVRFLRNSEYEFEMAYRLMFNKAPRIV